MQINIAFRHMDATDALKTHVQEKSEKLRKYLGGEAQLTWTFSVDAGVHVADVHAKGPHIDFFAESKTEDMYQSIEEATDKLEKQLRKNKEILKDHLHRK